MTRTIRRGSPQTLYAGAAALITDVLAILQRNPALLRKARFLQLNFELTVGEQTFRVAIDRGAVAIGDVAIGDVAIGDVAIGDVATGTGAISDGVAVSRDAMATGNPAVAEPAFTLRANDAAWQEFSSAELKPDYHDVIAMIESGHATISGDLLPFFRNLFFIKGVLAASFRGDAAW
jgi:hypothetical protein